MFLLGVQYSVVLGILVTQMIFFCMMVTLPRTWFYNFATMVKQDPYYRRAYRWTNIIHFTLSGVLFSDALYKLIYLEKNVPENLERAHLSSNLTYQSNEFQAQRNFLLCGTSLFLTFVLNRYLSLLFRTVELEVSTGKTPASVVTGAPSSLKNKIN